MLARLLTEENREMLDIVSSLSRLNIKKSVISLPSLIVCGDQSTGKSSVLEAATGIAFPRKAGLCTRFPTEISLRHDDIRKATVRINPHPDSRGFAKERMEKFTGMISDFNNLPGLVEAAQKAMGLGEEKNFAKDVLCIEISGPDLPHLTLVDLPGLIKNAVDGVTPDEVSLVAELTEEYIQQSRAICLPVISALHDFANQGIVDKVQAYDATGNRTLGIVTKPDRCDVEDEERSAAIALIQNKRKTLKLGWHVLRNRNEDETNRKTSNHERNFTEQLFFQKHGWKDIPEGHWGAEALTVRLSELLIKHTKRELPKVRKDVEAEYAIRHKELEALGMARETPQACKDFLLDLSIDYGRDCKAALDGHYESNFFKYDDTQPFDDGNKLARRRLRAMIQFQNKGFSDTMRVWGHRYNIQTEKAGQKPPASEPEEIELPEWPEPKLDKPAMTKSLLTMKTECEGPITKSYTEALEWVQKALIRSRGRELQGNFNPLIIGELFREQSAKWHRLAEEHLNDAFNSCTRFLRDLLDANCASDVMSRVWASIFETAMKEKKQAAMKELGRLMNEINSYPINYNHYYTDMITRNRMARQKKSLKASLESATTEISESFSCNHRSHAVEKVDIEAALQHYTERLSRDMDEYSSEGILDCVLAIYKVHQKTFVANVTTQVVERHIVCGLENIFSPKLIAKMKDDEVVTIASEPTETKKYRSILQENVKKLNEGRDLLREIVRTTAQE
ncbi:hypothetical protein BU16DRAFT_460137 [Lophium mytilinum]|uniref:Dynamin family protein n=1 Tax=Lophium mytilinum TaxID=390894 RepID=A0A6A6QW59_9PEZI|nr:hypothetical protein BU16DRAFT_460137 [Lophium mytilinum]